ncbi:hypothetical protein D3C72_2477390 [compost metagenome]
MPALPCKPTKAARLNSTPPGCVPLSGLMLPSKLKIAFMPPRSSAPRKPKRLLVMAPFSIESFPALSELALVR